MSKPITIKITGNDRGFRKALDRSEKRLSGFASNIRSKVMPAIGTGVAVAGAAAGFVIGRGIVQGVNDAVSFDEIENKIAAIGGAGSLAAFREWGATSADQFGMGLVEGGRNYGDFMNIGATLGLAGGELDAWVKQQMANIADLGSFHEKETEEVVTSMMALFRGEFEPMTKFIPNISNAFMIEYGVAEGIIEEGTKKLDAAMRLEVGSAMLEDESINQAYGDFQRSIDGTASVLERLKAKFEDIKLWVGQKLLPVLFTLATWLNDRIIPAFQAFSGWLGEHVVPVVREVWEWLGPKLGEAVQAVGTWIRGTLVPAVQELASWFADTLLPALRNVWDYVRADVVDAASTLWAWLQKIAAAVAVVLVEIEKYVPWETLGSLIKTIYDNLRDMFRGLDDAWNKLREFYGELREGNPWAMGLATALGAIAAAVGAIKLSALIKTFSAWITKTYALAAAKWAAVVPTVILAGKILLVAAAVGLLVAGFAWAYQNLGWFRTGVDAVVDALQWLWDKLVAVFNWVKGNFDILLMIFPLTAVPTMIVKFWGPIKDFFTGLPGKIKDAAGDIWGFLTEDLPGIPGKVWGFLVTNDDSLLSKLMDLPGRLLEGVTGVFGFLLETAKAGATAAWDWLTGTEETELLGWLKTLPGMVAGAAGDVFGFLVDSAKGAATAAANAIIGAINWLIRKWNGLEFGIAGFSVGTPDIAELSRFGGGDAIGGSSGSRQREPRPTELGATDGFSPAGRVNVTQNFHVQGSVDYSAAAQAIAWAGRTHGGF